LKKKYIYGNSQILAQHDVPDNNEVYFYLHDRLGSVRLVIDDIGNCLSVVHKTRNPAFKDGSVSMTASSAM
jgi:hypothetical protein